MKWNEFYKFPLMVDEYCGHVIAQPGESGYRYAFDWIPNEYISEYPIRGQKGEQLVSAIVAYLNGESKYRPYYNWTICETDPTVICINGQPCIYIRGWGELTGIGACHLTPEEAEKIQNDFRDFIVNKLNGNE